ncbi:DUF3156 family protein [Pseudomonas sp. 148P]|uniref:DUF3156 family protein n=1 Tax=Pseudomonas ulcerans TaxID=3115852 RepID=A0ABU7I1S9_9PSED|nr:MULTISPECIES: DUF3156 family protein [unclassified Pseudomonas]MEE1924086.1 DUF3156 family protein [Pseudomonas sp. 147P]MEE1937755.1 DUF3156 family protein [Pseudomonas sp. 148P]
MAATTPNLWQRLFDRAPSGYRPGVTLEHLRRNLGLAGCQVLESGRARFSLADGVEFEVRERTESQLLMHIVVCEFRLQCPAASEGAATLELHHTGAIRRSGLGWKQKGGEAGLLERIRQRLEQDATLHQALMPLDFKRLRLERAEGQWTVVLEHMGGSEVVNRMPAFRRYIRVDSQQRALLLSALTGLQRLLAQV